MISRKQKNMIYAVSHSGPPTLQLDLLLFTVDAHINRNDMDCFFLFVCSVLVCSTCIFDCRKQKHQQNLKKQTLLLYNNSFTDNIILASLGEQINLMFQS